MRHVATFISDALRSVVPHRVVLRCLAAVTGCALAVPAHAGCLPPPPGPLRTLAAQMGARPDRVLGTLEATDPGDQLAWRDALRAEAHDLLSQSDDARRIAGAALRTADPRSPVYVELLTRFAMNGFRQEEAAEAEVLVRRALHGRAPGAAAVCLRTALGEIARIRSRPDQAITDLSAAYAMASRLNLPQQRVVTAEKLARVMDWGGDYQEARSLIDEVAAWAEARGETFALATAYYFRGMFAIRHGAFEEALRDMRRSRETGAETNDVVGTAYLDLQTCRIMIELERYREAEPLCRQAERTFRTVGDDAAGQANVLLARIAMTRGDAAAALRRLDGVLGSASARSSGVQIGTALKLRSEVNAALGHRDQALADLSAYVTLTDRMDRTEREKQLVVQRARFATDRQEERSRELARDLQFAQEREAVQQRQTRIVMAAGGAGLLLLGIIVFMGWSHRRRLIAVAEQDNLTSLLNRRAMNTRAPKVIASAYEQHRPVALAIIDLDHFKQINDGFGHGVGDHVLKRFAAAATATLRRFDLIARWGGEEFVILVAGLRECEVAAALDHLRHGLHGEEIVAGDPTRIRFSAGVSRLTPYETFETAVARADRALYEAKRNGRDRTVLA